MTSYHSPYGGFPPADPWAPYKPQLRRNANFVGASLLFLCLLHLSLFSVLVVLLMQLGVLPADALSPEKVNTLGIGNTAYLLLYLPVYVAVMGLPMLIACGIFRPAFSPLDLSERVKPGLFIGCVFIGMAMCAAANVVASVWTSFFASFGVDVPDVPSMMENEPVSLALNLLIMAVMPAILEEFFFRGYVLQALRPYGDTFAVVVSALLFGLMHGNLTQLPFAFLLGLIFGFFAVRLGNIWVCCVIHFLNNAVAVLLGDFLPYYVTDPMWQNVIVLGVFGLFAAVGLCIFIVMMATGHPLFRKKEPSPTMPPLSLRVGQFFLSPMVIISLLLFALQTALNTQ